MRVFRTIMRAMHILKFDLSGSVAGCAACDKRRWSGSVIRIRSDRESSSEQLDLAESTNFWYFVTMNKNTSISLGDHFADFVDEQVAQGRYSSASEVVRAGLRLLEEREASLQALRAALIEGERSGASEPIDFDAFIAEKRKSASAAK